MLPYGQKIKIKDFDQSYPRRRVRNVDQQTIMVRREKEAEMAIDTARALMKKTPDGRLKQRITQLEEELAVYKQGTQQTAEAKAAKRRKQSQQQQRAAFKAHEQQQAAGSGSGSSSSSSSSSSRRGPGKV